MWLLLTAYTGDDPDPTETGATETGTSETGTTSTAHTGTPTGALAVTTDRFDMCPDPYDYGYPPELSATAPAAGEVAIDYAGPVSGCGCGGEVLAWLEGTDVLGVRIDAGDCDGVFCCEVEATVSGVPSGNWTIELAGPTGATADVIVP